MRLRRLGIRARITGGSLLIAIALSVVAGVIINNQVERIVHDGEVSVLDSVAAPYRAALKNNPAERLDPPGSKEAVALVDPSGITRVDTLPDQLIDQLPRLLDARGTHAASVGGVSYLVQTSTVSTSEGMWTIIAARNNAAEAGVFASITALLVASLAFINLGFGAASLLIGTAALRPVEGLRRSAEKLASTRGDELLPVGPADDEIAHLARTLNELIAELRASAERERQIVSDASHELRTPLAILQTRLELAQTQASTLAEMRTEVASAHDTLLRLSSMATSLLELSRIDAQSSRGAATPDELATELADAADRGRLRVGGGAVQLNFAVELPTALSTQTVAIAVHDFGRLCDNLVSNALAARPDAGTIELSLRAVATGVQLAVDDEAGGMDDEFVAHAFDRFARDPSASSSGSGAGLGLAIVSGIVQLAGGTVTLINRPGHGLRVEIELPFEKRGD